MSDEHGYIPGSPGHRQVVTALFAAGVATFALLYSTQAILPELAREFGVSTGASTLTVSLTTIGLGGTLLVAGPFSDMTGRTRLIHISLGAAVGVAFLCAFAPGWTALLGLRLLQGIALAGLPAVATAYLREELHPSCQAGAAGLYIGGTALGGMAGRLVTGAVAEPLGWRWALGAIAFVGLVCLVVVRILLPRSRHFVPAPAGMRSLASMTRRAVSDPVLVALYAIGGCSMGALVATFNTLGFRLHGAPFHLGLGVASLVFLAYPIGSVSSALAGRWADRIGRRAVVPLGSGVAILGVLLTLPSYLPVMVLGVALLIAGFFAVHGVASGWVPARAHAGGVAAANAASLYLFTYYLGSSVFGTLAGPIWTHGGWAGVVTLTTALLAVSGCLSLMLKKSRPVARAALV